jgi:glucose/arabinose dehydrogenase
MFRIRSIISAVFGMAVLLSGHAYAQSPMENTSLDEQKTHFGCELIGGAVQCDRILHEFQSYLVEASTESIYPVTKDESDIRFVEGVGGSQALEFKAYFGEFVNIGNKAELNPSEFSVSFWVKRPAEDFRNYGHVVSHVNAGGSAGWLFDIANTTSQSIRFGVTNSSGGTFYTEDVQISNSSFTNVVGTFDGSSVRIYGNGTLLDAVPFAGSYNPDPQVPLKVAMSSFNFGFPWGGIIDEVGIYNKSLTEEVNGTDNGSFLVAHWPFDGTVQDTAGNSFANYMIQTVGMAFAPDGRLFFTEKNTGKIRVLDTAQNDTVLEEPFAIVPDLRNDMEQGLLGIAVDPDFEENRYVYAYYTKQANDTAPTNRVVRYTDVDNFGTNMTVIIDGIPAHRGGMHAGGAISFGPHDSKLYITVGDAYQPEEAQDSSSLLGKVLRINKDGTIPHDNPFPGSPVYTVGHRNAFGIAFDGTGNGMVSENGEDLYDEMNMLVKGGNYGHPTMQMPNMPPAAGEDSIKPVRSYWKTVAPTQAIYYDGAKFPELAGKFLVGSYNNGRLYALEINGTLAEELKIQFPYRDQSVIIAIASSPLTGDIYYGGYYIYKLQSVDLEGREPILAVVSVASAHNVTGLHFDVAGKRAVVTYVPAGGPLVVEVPKILLDGITLVANDGAQNLEFAVESMGPVNVVTVEAPAGKAPISVSIAGNSTVLGAG